MTRTSPDTSTTERRLPEEIGQRRWQHLRHIRRMTHEQQIALVEEARAARQAEQARRADS